MKKFVAVILPFLLVLTACSPIENSARDTAAALAGTISFAQAKVGDSCRANPSQKVCVLINNGVSAQNALVTSVETYCGWSTTAPPPDPGAKCVPVKAAEPALRAAISNATQLVTEIRGAI